MTYLIYFFLMTSGEGGKGNMGTLFFFAAILLVMYFFMIRPQTKKAKDQRNFTKEIKKGDKIVTMGGLHGTITKINDDTLIIDSEGTSLMVERSSISMETTKAHYAKDKS